MSKGFHTVDLHACASAAIPTPAIGQNGNWYVGNDDTGVSANGTPGPKGDKGDTGDKGQDADVSRVEQLEEDVSKLNSDLNGTILATFTSIGSQTVEDISNYRHLLFVLWAHGHTLTCGPVPVSLINLYMSVGFRDHQGMGLYSYIKKISNTNLRLEYASTSDGYHLFEKAYLIGYK